MLLYGTPAYVHKKSARPPEAAEAERRAVLVAEFKRWHPQEHWPAMLRFADPAVGADRGVVATAVAIDGRALQLAQPELRADRELVLAAVASRGLALEFASLKLQQDRTGAFREVAS